MINNDYNSLIIPASILKSLSPFLARADSDFLNEFIITPLFLLSVLKR